MTHLAVLYCALSTALAHCRWWWPPPRSSDPGIKAGPCGADPFGSTTLIQPGQLSLTWLNTVAHSGTPWRIALRREGDAPSFEDCVLLNHIPGEAHPKTGVPDGLYRVTVTIPDIQCTRCTLQLFNPMTDKITRPSCTFDPAHTIGPTGDAPTCGSNYFSCADVSINGTGTAPLDATTCASLASAAGWPYSKLEPLVYNKDEAATWTAVPDEFPTVDSFSQQATGATIRVLGEAGMPAYFSAQAMPRDGDAATTMRRGRPEGSDGEDGGARLHVILASSLGGVCVCVLLFVLARRSCGSLHQRKRKHNASEQRSDAFAAAGNNANAPASTLNTLSLTRVEKQSV